MRKLDAQTLIKYLSESQMNNRWCDQDSNSDLSDSNIILPQCQGALVKDFSTEAKIRP